MNKRMGNGRSKPSADMRLTEFFETCFQPLWLDGGGCDVKTHQSYRDSLRWWAVITDDPPLSEIDPFVTAKFVSELGKQPGRKEELLAVSTVRKHVRQIQTVLDLAGPASRQRPEGLGLVERVPFLRLPRADLDPPCGDFTLEEIHAIYRAAGLQYRPNHVQGVSPAAWWRTLIVVAYYTGLRISALMGLEFDMIEDEWLRVPARISKRRKGIRQYLAKEARRELEQIQTERHRIFDWPRWPQSSRSLQECRMQLLARAGIRKSRRFGFQGFRRAHLTMVNVQAAELGARTAQLSAGHASVHTTQNHYLNAAVTEQLLAQAIEAMPSPIPADLRKAGDSFN